MATTSRPRIETLDIIRGVAVMGILTMNIYAFAAPFSMYSNPTAYGSPNGLDWLVWAFEFLFFESKFRSLFSIMFGASTLLVIELASAKRQSPALRHFSRMGWLILIGLAHYWFIWAGDILALYGLVGLVAFAFHKLPIRWLIMAALACFAYAAFVVNSFNVSASIVANPDPSPELQAAAEQQMDMVERFFGRDEEKIAEDLSLYQGPYEPILQKRFVEQRTKPLFNALFLGPETLGLFLIGMALFKTGFLTGGWPRERYRKWAATCLGIGLVGNSYLLWLQVQSGFDALTIINSTMLYSVPFDILMAIGWAALITLWAKQNLGQPLAGRLAATGRMAFTNYLVTSIVMTTIFYGYGLGLFGQFGRAALLPFVFGMWALMLLWSKPWLDRFHYGPLEWIWRTLSRFSPQPMLKTA
ncbi:DUF418 domain-containing protein [Sphingomicrobium marinum]|uniref:DUF418 domain-containing protein n=1 Tax=Sphingomicrobium marinum TaxID=1227950 RepID=UPI00224002C5|nr:DUF418 domain-containing protein [Sphingomicrobium marinum]